MTVKYKTVITKAGAIKLAAATLPDGKKVNLTAMAVGDGGGTLPVPDPNQTKLVKEVWRHALNKISQDRKNKNYVVAELLIPPETGGFWMRELGLYDDTGTLIAVGNMAESYKPALAEGSGRAQTVRMVIMVSDIESVELTIDTTTVMATQDYVDDRLAEHEQSRRHPDATLTAKGFTQLSSATDSASESVAATPKAVKTAYDLAKGKYTAQDATTAQKGIVQLSSATDSASESVAATPKAVKTAYDLAKGKYTAQDATTAQKGIVQLSSAIDSTSETLAATPKAVKAANDNANGRVPSGRKVNGRALSADINITAQDIFNGQAVGIGNAEDLNAYSTPGLYYQPANAQAQTGKNYPETAAGSLEVYKHAGITQIYRIYNSSRAYIRSLYSGTWSAWIKQYDAANKPTPADIGALASNGNAVSATKLQTSRTIGGVAFDGTASINLPGVNTGGNQSTTGNAATATKLQTARAIGGVAFDGTANINLPGVNTGGNQSTTGNAASATKLQTARTIAGVSFNGTANIAIPAGNVGAYTKAECDARYGIVNGIRRGGQQIRNPTDTWFDNWESPAGCVVTGIQMNGRSDGRKLGVYFRQMQYLNKQTGAWVNLGD
ncbi:MULTISPECIES: phage tail-collar fiber domain-containing protein [Enterobacter cloacae complex]|nr:MULTISPECIES: phage tail protein [Enterobacter cloacae complex]AWR68755.1 phage tail protein [Enterobacter hormaechei subsp. xiangfangensis]AXL99553.1 phage tail protein [Enterobacter hormaechei subsp. xiangfangensis]EHK3215931.1 phage tail protein [Enterobacter hormaechei]EHK3221212.1 phage tail protein [Enterobacter hormaechei]EHK3224931.1 phage tail protein [Enterobacter hormaechei]